jgi:hypothetical protein
LGSWEIVLAIAKCPIFACPSFDNRLYSRRRSKILGIVDRAFHD